MPTCLASGTKTCFHYKGNITPPADYDKWKDFIHAFTAHLVERYGLEEVKQWFFEVWNEPNLPFFFDGTQEDYFKLYQASAEAIKSVNQELKVGGPSTSINAWVPETIEFCKKNNVPLDFVSTHHYPTDDPLWRSGIDVETFFKTGMYKNHVDIKRGTLTEMCTRTKEEAQGLPLYYTEWNVSANTNHEIHDTEYAAAMVAKTLADNDGLVEAYSFWTFTDIFEESSQLCGFFHGGFGLQTVAGVEKPAYRLFEIMHGLGDTRIAISGDTADSTVEALAVKGENELKVLVYNHNLEKMPIEPQEVTISLEGIDHIKSMRCCRIDAKHGNAYTKWLEVGKPDYPKHEVIEQLKEASKLLYEDVVVADQVSVIVPEYGVYLLEISL
jgi:xylan 1,4-beta-xylosidase